MIEGYISGSGAPILEMKVKGRRDEVTVEGILDTGFDGYLCLLIPIAVSLGLGLVKVVRTELADGTILEDELVFAGKVEWDGEIREADVLLTRTDDILSGTAFLRGYQVRLDYGNNTVRIERIAG